MTSKKKVKIIDLFAGPGGLGEGFSNCKKDSPFEISISVEKDKDAHETLTLRAYFRKLLHDKTPYLNYIKAKSGGYVDQQSGKNISAPELKSKIKNTAEWKKASEETLGSPHALGNSRIFEILKKGEKPEIQDFEETEEQRRINLAVEKICKYTKRGKNRSIKNSEPLMIIGGPPCQAYSKIGRGRQAGSENYNQDHDERFFLYKEYADLISRSRPDVFVMENVSGIGSAKLANGSLIFPQIIKRLEYLKENPGKTDQKKYNIYSLVKKKCQFLGNENSPNEKDFLVRAVEFGVPQARERVILLGVNCEIDNGFAANNIMESKGQLSAPNVSQTIGSLPKLRSSLTNRKDEKSIELFPEINFDKLSESTAWLRTHQESIKLIKRIVSEPGSIDKAVDEVLDWDLRTLRLKKAKKIAAEYEISLDEATKIVKIEKSERNEIAERSIQYKKIIKTIYPSIREVIREIQSDKNLETGNSFFYGNKMKVRPLNSRKSVFSELANWLETDLPGTFNHSTKKHMPSDIARYLFTSLWTEAAARVKEEGEKEVSLSPRTKFFPKKLASNHISWYSDNFQDRFRAHPKNHRSKTITAHMKKDGHANIHYDPAQCRSLTVREAARLQTFPDNYFFEGGQAAQFLQVGNAVPPFLAKQIALHVEKILKSMKRI
ncbi:DNA cytosine methyltransferase [Microbulbifer aggregans]|uniref:DNA cytosine methyltransferase n=1 Tax=Microbulbifer aggregans TaxID=1769779 RepID=UPI001CFC9877|nr:DNA cytosine methyltransferase [Microbulbifer aggregans]